MLATELFAKEQKGKDNLNGWYFPRILWMQWEEKEWTE